MKEEGEKEQCVTTSSLCVKKQKVHFNLHSPDL